MANYSALWTSANDPEYLQIKKVKQLTERHLAMNIMEMDKTYRRRIKKAQEQIRENQDILELLEREKETRARHILATYHKHQRMRSTAHRLIGNFRLKKDSQNSENREDKTSHKPGDEALNKMTKLTLTPSTRQRVLMVETFPFVYHSHGDKPCPRYDMFLESQEYGPPEVKSEPYAWRKGTKIDKDGGRGKRTSIPSLPAVLERRKSSTASFGKVMAAFKVIRALSHT